MISFDSALQITIDSIEPLTAETLPLSQLVGRTLAQDLAAVVDAPSVDVSLKDGYALQPADVATAAPHNPISLRLIGKLAAGGSFKGVITPGTAVRVLSGAPIPAGAGSVLAEEFAVREEDRVLATADAAPGRNIMAKGSDIARGQRILPAGTVLRPAQVGLIAAAGHSGASVLRRPKVAIIATGDEVVAPGQPLKEGSVFASNLVTLEAWCHHYDMSASVVVVKDDPDNIRDALLEAIAGHDAILTSGGAWSGERDLVAGLLDQLGWEKMYHRVRLGPGKGVGFGLWRDKPVFILPGGPPSNQMAFLQLALPGLHRLSGRRQLGLPSKTVQLAKRVTGQEDWTQFLEGLFEETATGLQFRPVKQKSRLQSMAGCQGYMKIPEGISAIETGEIVKVQLLPYTDVVHDETLFMPPSPPVVSFVARSGTGKTTFMEKLIPELKSLGLTVGVMKHHAHPSPFDVPGKDTYRLSQAGADIVVGHCPVQTAIFIARDGSTDLDQVVSRHFPGMDLVLTEGYKRGPYPKIELFREARAAEEADGQPPLLCDPSELLAVVTDKALSLPESVPQFSLDDHRALAQFLVNYAT